MSDPRCTKTDSPLAIHTLMKSISRSLIVAALNGLVLTSHAEDASARNILPPPGVTKVESLPQNWSHAESSKFYNTTQGSQIMPYKWFLHLKLAGSETSFLDADHVRQMGYIARKPEAENPDGLPIGFVKNVDKQGRGYVGLTCAACHTGQLRMDKTLWIIVGGQAQADAHRLMADLEAALRDLLGKPDKLKAFAQGVLGAEGTQAEQDRLQVDLAELVERRAAYNRRNFPHDLAAGGGPGRLDAFNAIFNEVAVRFAQVPDAETRCDAPTSYPFLWDTPQHDRVQWNGSAKNTVVAGLEVGALGRNIGEVVGVFADVDTSQKTPLVKGYRSSADLRGLIQLENTLRQLWSPLWVDAIGKTDPELTKQGEGLFKSFCARCHETGFQRTSDTRKIEAKMSNVGTDPGMATSAATRKTASGVFTGRKWLDGLIPKEIKPIEPIAHLLQHMGQRVLVGGKLLSNPDDVGQFSYSFTGEIKHAGEKISGELTEFISEKDTIKAKIKLALDNTKQKLDALAGQTTVFKPEYKARPLNGIWATGPYLHNGSVLNLDQLLLPADKRLKTFKTGTLTFDPINVGYIDAGDYVFNATAPGNSNAGHEDYRMNPDNPAEPIHKFTDQERKALIEYMKGL